MANPSYYTFTSASSAGALSNTYQVNNQIAPINVAVSVVLSSASAATYSVQYTLDDLQGNYGAPVSTATRWYDSASASSITASTIVTFTSPIMAVRVSCGTAPSSSATAAVSFLQAGIIN